MDPPVEQEDAFSPATYTAVLGESPLSPLQTPLFLTL